MGGYVTARSWPAHQARGETWTVWVRDRALGVRLVGAGNTNPPSVALLAFALAQCGLALACEPAGSRLVLRPGLWRRVQRLNASVMTLYLWHFVPVIIVAVACYPAGVLPQPAIGSAQWWELRPAWFALLTVVLGVLTMLITRAERPLLRLPAAIGPPGPWSPAILLAGLVTAMLGLTRLAIAGLAPGGRLPLLALGALAAGLLATFCTGHPSNAEGRAYPAAGSATPLPHGGYRIGSVEVFAWSFGTARRRGHCGGLSPLIS